MTAKTPLVVNTSFKVDPATGVLTQAVGTPTTGAGEVSLWLAATVVVAKRQSNAGVIRNLQRFMKENFASLGAVAPDIIHGESITASAGNDCELNGTPVSSEIRIEIGNDVTSSAMIDNSIDRLLQAYLEASTGN